MEVLNILPGPRELDDPGGEEPGGTVVRVAGHYALYDMMLRRRRMRRKTMMIWRIQIQLLNGFDCVLMMISGRGGSNWAFDY